MNAKGQLCPMPTITGTAGLNHLDGTIENDLILGLDGADIIRASSGDDTIYGGAGEDTIQSGVGADLIAMGDGDLLIVGVSDSNPTSGIDTIVNWSRIDRIAIGESHYYAEGAAESVELALAFANSKLTTKQALVVVVAVGPDVFVFAGNGSYDGSTAQKWVRIANVGLNDVNNLNFTSPPNIPVSKVINGSAERDVLRIDSFGNDTINGLGGNDVLARNPGMDLLDGGDGDDEITDEDNGDTLLGGAGDDRLTLNAGSDDTYRVSPYPGVAKFSLLDGGPGNDTIGAPAGIATRLRMEVLGGAGNDVISIGGGSGFIDAGPGDDRVSVGGGSFYILPPELPIVTLGAGSDEIAFLPENPDSRLTLLVTDFQAGDGGDRVNLRTILQNLLNYPLLPPPEHHIRLAADGPDTVLQIDYDGPSGSRGFVDVIRFLNTPAAGITQFNTSGYDLKPVAISPTTYQATSGADRLSASATARELHGGAGGDTISAASVVSYLRGDEGADSLQGGMLFDDINGNAGDDTASGGSGDDWVVGGKDNDYLFGDLGNDLVYGNLGDDTLEGGDGQDVVRGGQGNDLLRGGAGNDFLSGDRGDDQIYGGAGADTFSGASGIGIDRIMDFAPDTDVLRLAPGTSYTVRAEGSDVVVDLGGGDIIRLVSVSLGALPATGWLFVG